MPLTGRAHRPREVAAAVSPSNSNLLTGVDGSENSGESFQVPEPPPRKRKQHKDSEDENYSSSSSLATSRSRSRSLSRSISGAMRRLSLVEAVKVKGHITREVAQQNLCDLDLILDHIGITAALLLSFVVSIMFALSREDLASFDMRNHILTRGELFNRLAVQRMEMVYGGDVFSSSGGGPALFLSVDGNSSLVSAYDSSRPGHKFESDASVKFQIPGLADGFDTKQILLEGIYRQEIAGETAPSRDSISGKPHSAPLELAMEHMIYLDQVGSKNVLPHLWKSFAIATRDQPNAKPYSAEVLYRGYSAVVSLTLTVLGSLAMKLTILLSGTHEDPSECGVMAQLLVKPFGVVGVFVLGMLMLFGLFSFFLQMGAALLFMLVTRWVGSQAVHYVIALPLMIGGTLVFLVGSLLMGLFATKRAHARAAQESTLVAPAPDAEVKAAE